MGMDMDVHGVRGADGLDETDGLETSIISISCNRTPHVLAVALRKGRHKACVHPLGQKIQNQKQF